MRILVETTEDVFQIPQQMTAGAAGMDLYAANRQQIVVPPGAVKLIPTGIKVAIPDGYEMQVRPRSGLTLKHGITVLNSPGTVDSDYRGEVGVILHNTTEHFFYVNRGDRIAQAVVSKYEKVEMVEVDSLNSTERGAGGFGHTGK